MMKKTHKKLVLGLGELTGHEHVIRNPRAKLTQLDADRRQLHLPEQMTLRHEKHSMPAEHRDIKLPVGDPIVTHKRRYTPGGWAPVED